MRVFETRISIFCDSQVFNQTFALFWDHNGNIRLYVGWDLGRNNLSNSRDHFFLIFFCTEVISELMLASNISEKGEGLRSPEPVRIFLCASPFDSITTKKIHNHEPVTKYFGAQSKDPY